MYIVGSNVLLLNYPKYRFLMFDLPLIAQDLQCQYPAYEPSEKLMRKPSRGLFVAIVLMLKLAGPIS